MKNIFAFFICFLISVSIFSQTKGLNFDGQDDFVSIAEKVGALTGSSITFEAWVKISAFNRFSYLVNKRTSSNYFALIFNYNSNEDIRIANPYLNVFLYNGTANGQIFYDVSFDWINQWHHLAVTYSGSQIILYVDGLQVATQPFSGSIPASGQGISLGDGPGFGRLASTMDEVRIWNVVRTQAEIQAAMNGEIPANTVGLTGYYRMNEGTTNGDNTGITAITDLSSSPTNGTLNNFARTGSTSNFTTGYTSLIALPLKNNSFIATKRETSIELNWKQAASDMPSVFEVERSADGTSFFKIGALNGKAGIVETGFAFADIKPNAGTNYYRLKLIEADNRISYSSIVAARLTGSNAALQLYPVPARNTLQLEINAPTGTVFIRVKNLAGSTIKSIEATSAGSTLFTSIDIGAFTKGTYLVQVNKGSLLFIKQ